MTNEQIIVLISVIVAGITGLATIATNVRGYFWSKDYREAKQAEMDAKDAGYQAKESEYKTQLETKEERIRLFELIADPEYGDMVQKKFDEQKSNIHRLQETIQKLEAQLSEANDQIEALKKEIAKLSISDTERSSLRVYTAGSSTALDSLNETASVFTTLSGEIEKSAFDIRMLPSPISFDEILRDRIIEQIRSLVRTEDESQDDESPAGGEAY